MPPIHWIVRCIPYILIIKERNAEEATLKLAYTEKTATQHSTKNVHPKLTKPNK